MLNGRKYVGYFFSQSRFENFISSELNEIKLNRTKKNNQSPTPQVFRVDKITSYYHDHMSICVLGGGGERDLRYSHVNDDRSHFFFLPSRTGLQSKTVTIPYTKSFLALEVRQAR